MDPAVRMADAVSHSMSSCSNPCSDSVVSRPIASRTPEIVSKISSSELPPNRQDTSENLSLSPGALMRNNSGATIARPVPWAMSRRPDMGCSSMWGATTPAWNIAMPAIDAA